MKSFLLYIIILFMLCSCDVYEQSSERLNQLQQQEQTAEVVQQEAYFSMTKDGLIMLFCCLMIVGVVVIVCYLFFSWHSAKMQRKIDDERHERTQLQADYEQISARIKDREASLAIMNDYIYNHLSIASRLLSIDDNTRTIHMTERDWLELEVYLNTTQNHFVDNFRQYHPEAPQEVLRFCMLLRLELSNRQMAVIYHIAEKSVKQKAYLYKEQLAGIPADMSLRAYVTSQRFRS